MCQGTFVVSYSCGHVNSTPGVCLQDVDPHYRCEPRGMKITQPNGRCIECYARDISPGQYLTTTIRFNPDPVLLLEKGQDITPQSSFDGEERIMRWVVDVPAPLIHVEREMRQTATSDQLAMADSLSSLRLDAGRSTAHTSRGKSRAVDSKGYEADDDSSF